MKFDLKRFRDFFRLLPRTTAQAARLARRCDDRMMGRAYLKPGSDRPMRHAVEIRHESFATPEFIDLLREQDIALVIADTVEWPLLFDVTSDFAYVRLHGSEELYASGYEQDAIELWAQRIMALSTGDKPDGIHAHTKPAAKRERDVFVYFDNDIKVRAPMDAQALHLRLQQMGAAVPLGVVTTGLPHMPRA